MFGMLTASGKGGEIELTERVLNMRADKSNIRVG